jgi:hypothetical protein
MMSNVMWWVVKVRAAVGGVGVNQFMYQDPCVVASSVGAAISSNQSLYQTASVVVDEIHGYNCLPSPYFRPHIQYPQSSPSVRS